MKCFVASHYSVPLSEGIEVENPIHRYSIWMEYSWGFFVNVILIRQLFSVLNHLLVLFFLPSLVALFGIFSGVFYVRARLRLGPNKSKRLDSAAKTTSRGGIDIVGFILHTTNQRLNCNCMHEPSPTIFAYWFCISFVFLPRIRFPFSALVLSHVPPSTASTLLAFELAVDWLIDIILRQLSNQSRCTFVRTRSSFEPVLSSAAQSSAATLFIYILINFNRAVSNVHCQLLRNQHSIIS